MSFFIYNNYIWILFESWYIKIPLEQILVQPLWYGLATSTQKTYIIATNSYTKYRALFGKIPFFAQVRGLETWINNLRRRRLKTKTIIEYLAEFQSFCLNCTSDIAKLGIYNHLIFQKIIVGLQRLYGKRNTCECQPITFDILLKLISKFDQTTLEVANLHIAFFLACAGFWRMGKFTYN